MVNLSRSTRAGSNFNRDDKQFSSPLFPLQNNTSMYNNNNDNNINNVNKHSDLPQESPIEQYHQ